MCTIELPVYTVSGCGDVPVVDQNSATLVRTDPDMNLKYGYIINNNIINNHKTNFIIKIITIIITITETITWENENNNNNLCPTLQ